MAKKPDQHIIRVGICNPNNSIRLGKSLLINSQADMQVVFEADSAEVVLEKIADLTLDVLLVDHRLNQRDGISLVRDLNQMFFSRQEWPPTTIVTAPFFAVDLDIAVMRSGAADFVVEESGPEQLLAAIRTVAQKEHEVDLVSLSQLFAAVQVPHNGEAWFSLALQSLDAKALEVLQIFESGAQDVEIAGKLGISELRVRQLFRRILIHFGFTTREQLVLALYESGRLGD